MFDVVTKPIEGAKKDGIWGFGTGRKEMEKRPQEVISNAAPSPKAEIGHNYETQHARTVTLELSPPKNTINNLFNHSLSIDYLL